MPHYGCSYSPKLSSKLLRIPAFYRHALLSYRTPFPRPTAPLLSNNHTFRSVSSTSPSTTRNAAPFNSPPRLDGTTCMITGGASGIGFAIAQRFLREGAGKIILVGRRKERLINALDRLRGEHVGIPQETCGDETGAESSAAQEVNENNGSDVGGGRDDGKLSSAKTQDSTGHGGPENLNDPESDRLALKVGDVGDQSFWSDEIKNTMDTVDILINAAGVSHSALLPLAKDEHIAQILRTNLQGTIFACRAMTRRALRSQRKQQQQQQQQQQQPREASSGDSGRKTKCIINISSLHATKGGIGASTYASTKAGVIALTRAIAAEGSASASGATVRANVIVPGYIETEMLDEFSDAFRGEARQSIPLKRFGTAEEVADAAAFLATNQYANNCVLNLDGGLSAI